MLITKLLNVFSHLFDSKSEHYFIVEELDNGIETTEAKIENESRKITLNKQEALVSLADLKRPFVPINNLVLALSTKNATTIQSSINLRRANNDEPIGEESLDSMVFKSFWEFLNRYRAFAANKMGISDSEIVLANIEIVDIELDRYKVFNPLGFKGKNLTLTLRGTFVPRDILRVMERVRGWSNNLVVMEGLSIVSKALPNTKDYVIYPQTKTTSVFSLGEENMHHKDFPWGTSFIVENIAKNLSVDYDVSEAILKRYVVDGFSKKVNRIVEASIRESLEGLAKVLPHNLRGGDYHFRLNVGQINSVSFRNWLESKDYNIDIRDTNPHKNYDATLVYLTQNYSLPHYQFLNQLLKRRSKWLITNL
ncbi:MAG: hypothetical protein AAB617_00080 [Patescibacteria group bacterium]